jgi:uncharacterized repeat protein (TIGR01451 family)
MRRSYQSNWQLAGVFIDWFAIILIAFMSLQVNAQTKAVPAQKPPSAASSAASTASTPKTTAAPLQSEYKYEKAVKDARGKEKLEPLGSLQAGDMIVYTATHRNVSPRGLVNVDLGVAIPPGTTYVPGSADPSYGRLMTLPNGQKQLLWNVTVIEANSAVRLTMRVQINPAPAAPAPAASAAPATAASAP